MITIEEVLSKIKEQATNVREQNSYRGRVNNYAEWCAGVLDRLHDQIKERAKHHVD